MTDRWLRWYEGSIRDGKFRIVAEEAEETVATVVGIWAALLEDASASVPRGNITKGLGWHSTYLQIGEERLGTVWNGFERLDMIDVKNDVRHITNWCKRQFETDHTDPTSRQRKDKWKQRHIKKERSGTLGNAQERSGTPDTETETYTEKKKKEDALRASSPTKGSRLAKDWRPNEEGEAFASEQGFSASQIADQLERFRDYWLARAGPKGVMLDWDRTWKRWIRTAKEGFGNGSGGPRALQDDKSAGRAAGRLAELAEKGQFTFGPRPSLLPSTGADVVQLLPERRGERP